MMTRMAAKPAAGAAMEPACSPARENGQGAVHGIYQQGGESRQAHQARLGEYLEVVVVQVGIGAEVKVAVVHGRRGENILLVIQLEVARPHPQEEMIADHLQGILHDRQAHLDALLLYRHALARGGGQIAKNQEVHQEEKGGEAYGYNAPKKALVLPGQAQQGGFLHEDRAYERGGQQAQQRGPGVVLVKRCRIAHQKNDEGRFRQPPPKGRQGDEPGEARGEELQVIIRVQENRGRLKIKPCYLIKAPAGYY